MRDRRHVFYGIDNESFVDERPDRRIPAAADAFYDDVDLLRAGACIFSTIAAMTFDEANGVAFFGPENPSEPADAHASTLPAVSVTVITVLL